MIEIAIVEDDPEERRKIRNCLKEFEANQDILFSVTEFENGLAFIGGYHTGYDIVFMDIDMPGMNGMETARELRKEDPSVLLIFVTNMAQYAVSGYEVDAMDFILKPINRYSFQIKLKRAVNRVPQRTDEYVGIRTDGTVKQVRITSIRYLDVYGHYVRYHTTGGDYTEYTTLKEASEKLKRSFFVPANRSVLVNLQYVTSVSKDTVTVGEDQLDISRPQRKTFLTAVTEYIGGRR